MKKYFNPKPKKKKFKWKFIDSTYFKVSFVTTLSYTCAEQHVVILFNKMWYRVSNRFGLWLEHVIINKNAVFFK